VCLLGSFSGEHLTFNQTDLWIPKNNTVSVSFASEASITVTAELGALQMTVSLPIEFQNQTSGLLGMFTAEEKPLGMIE